MPRYYRRRYTRVVRPKKKWASNLRQFVSDTITVTSSSPAGYVYDLVKNSTTASNPTPVIVKTGNFKVQGDVMISATGAAAGYLTLYAYVIFVPEGFVVTNGVQIQEATQSHPEWILCTKLLNTTGAGSAEVDSFSVSSRLKRNLNSGDRVIFAVVGVSNSSTNLGIRVNCQAQFWTCAN